MVYIGDQFGLYFNNIIRLYYIMNGRFGRRSSRTGSRGFQRQSYGSRFMNGDEPIEAV